MHGYQSHTRIYGVTVTLIRPERVSVWRTFVPILAFRGPSEAWRDGVSVVPGIGMNAAKKLVDAAYRLAG